MAAFVYWYGLVIPVICLLIWLGLDLLTVSWVVFVYSTPDRLTIQQWMVPFVYYESTQYRQAW
jgi:hypothetical protein